MTYKNKQTNSSRIPVISHKTFKQEWDMGTKPPEWGSKNLDNTWPSSKNRLSRSTCMEDFFPSDTRGKISRSTKSHRNALFCSSSSRRRVKLIFFPHRAHIPNLTLREITLFMSVYLFSLSLPQGIGSSIIEKKDIIRLHKSGLFFFPSLWHLTLQKRSVFSVTGVSIIFYFRRLS